MGDPSALSAPRGSSSEPAGPESASSGPRAGAWRPPPRVTDPACFNKTACAQKQDRRPRYHQDNSGVHSRSEADLVGLLPLLPALGTTGCMGCVVRAPAGCRGPGGRRLYVTGAQPHHLPSVPSESNMTAPGKGCPEPATWVTDCAHPKPSTASSTQPASTRHRMLCALLGLSLAIRENPVFSPPCWAGSGFWWKSQPPASLPSPGTCRPQAWPPTLQHLRPVPHAVLPAPFHPPVRQTSLSHWCRVCHQNFLTAVPSAGVLIWFSLHSGGGAQRPTPWLPGQAEPCFLPAAPLAQGHSGLNGLAWAEAGGGSSIFLWIVPGWQIRSEFQQDGCDRAGLWPDSRTVSLSSGDRIRHAARRRYRCKLPSSHTINIKLSSTFSEEFS